MAVLIPPRGEIKDPQYYAHGPDIPRALEAVDAARRTSGVLDQELDAQLVGLANLVIDPGRRQSLARRPAITVASDLHNNPFGLDVLERTAEGGPVFFVGDLTDRGSELETQLVRRAARSGKPFVFVSGNHDSDFLSRELAGQGAVVLTRNGRLNAGRHVRTGHLPLQRPPDRRLRRPYERQSSENFRDRYDDDARLRPAGPVLGLAAAADRQGRHRDGPRAGADPDRPGRARGQPAGAPARVHGRPHAQGGSEHPARCDRDQRREHGRRRHRQPRREHAGRRRAVRVHASSRFQPLAADIVSIDPGSGNSSARREILDEGGDQ